MRAVVSTRPDHGVSITVPTNEIMPVLTHGGAPEGYFGRTLDRDWEIEKWVRDPHWHSRLSFGQREQLAARWVDHFISGGLTDAEAYGLVRDKDSNDEWIGSELWDLSDIPTDRWFRDAWVRSHNGGPISVDLKLSKPIQFIRIKTEVDLETKRRGNDMELFDVQVDVDLRTIREKIKAARNQTELRCLWPTLLLRQRGGPK